LKQQKSLAVMWQGWLQ